VWSAALGLVPFTLGSLPVKAGYFYVSFYFFKQRCNNVHIIFADGNASRGIDAVGDFRKKIVPGLVIGLCSVLMTGGGWVFKNGCSHPTVGTH
jgi:hypothetical protein